MATSEIDLLENEILSNVQAKLGLSNITDDVNIKKIDNYLKSSEVKLDENLKKEINVMINPISESGKKIAILNNPNDIINKLKTIKNAITGIEKPFDVSTTTTSAKTLMQQVEDKVISLANVLPSEEFNTKLTKIQNYLKQYNTNIKYENVDYKFTVEKKATSDKLSLTIKDNENSAYRGLMGNDNHPIYSVVLNMLKQNASMADMCNFVKRSMIFDEIHKSIVHTKLEISKLEKELERKREIVNGLTTDMDVIDAFLNIECSYPKSINKQRKSLETERRKLMSSHPAVLLDAKLYAEMLNCESRLEKEQENLEYLENFIVSQIGKLCSMLEEERFIEKAEPMSAPESVPEPTTKEYSLTRRGIISANVAEVHPLVVADMMEQWDYFREFTSEQLVGLFSCFTDIKVQKDVKRSEPIDTDPFLESKIKLLPQMYAKYDRIELERDMRTGINYDMPLMYDITDEVMSWCKCMNEEECKMIINGQLLNKEISVGDFTKAILKISVITNELVVVCEKLGEVDLLHKLTQIDRLILKYIMMNQSLYV